MTRPLLVATAATAALTLCAASGTAAAATTHRAATGRGTSSLSLLDLTVGGHHLGLADLALISDTVASPRVSTVTVTPVTVDGTAIGRQTIDQSSSPKSVAAVTSPGALAPFAALSSPALNLSATGGPSNQAGSSSLGSIKVLGMPVSLAGALQTASAVSGVNGASGTKTITLKNLALPSIADVLGSLGLSLPKLPVGTLDNLASALELVNVAITNAQDAVDTAQNAVDAATASLAAKTSALTSAQGSLTSANGVLTTATATLNGVISSNSSALGGLGIVDIASLLAVPSGTLATAETLVPSLAPALTGYTSAQSAVTAAQAVVATAQTAVNTAQSLLNTVTATLNTALATLKGLLTGVLDKTPFVSLSSLEVSTRAVASSASKGGQHAQVVGGVVKGLKVLGVDVLDAALGSSTLDLTGTITSKLAEVNGVIADVTGTLSQILSNVPSLPKLEVPAPVIGLLTKSTKTSITDGFGRASTTVHALSISLPKITLPTSVAVPGAASLPGLAGVNQVSGLLSSAPLAIDLLTLHDQAAFRPALTGTPGGSNNGGKNLAGTGLPAGVAVMALLLVAAALGMRRRVLTLD